MASYAARRCKFCSATVFEDELLAHCDSEHGELNGVKFIDSGSTYEFNEFVNTFEQCDYQPSEKDIALQVPKAPSNILYDMGISYDKLTNSPHYNIGDGGVFSASEWNVCLRSLQTLGGTGFRLDRTAFVGSFMRFVLMNDASPKLDDKGGVVLRSESKISGDPLGGGLETEEIPWSRVLSAWVDALGPKSRKATFRRAARSLAPQMLNFVNTSAAAEDLKKNGTPLSHKFGIPNHMFYTAVSFFPAIKDPSSWSADERMYNDFRVRHTTAESSRAVPMDNRPGVGSPEQEQSVGGKMIKEHNEVLSRPSDEYWNSKDGIRFKTAALGRGKYNAVPPPDNISI